MEYFGKTFQKISVTFSEDKEKWQGFLKANFKILIENINKAYKVLEKTKYSESDIKELIMEMLEYFRVQKGHSPILRNAQELFTRPSKYNAFGT